MKDSRGNNSSIPIVNYYKAGKQFSIDSSSNIFKQVICGEDFTFVIDSKNDIYGFGNNERGQIGNGTLWDIEKPYLIQELKGKCLEVKTAGNITIALTFQNEVFIWPFENFKQQYKPLRIYLDKKITVRTISCGKNFALLLSQQGILFSFGKHNKCGELGTGDFKPRLTPETIYALADNGERIEQISCGYKHSIALSASGRVFSWGCVKFIKIITIELRWSIRNRS